MTTAADRLSTYREALIEDIERFVSERDAAQNGLVRLHVVAAAKHNPGLIAGPFGLGVADALALPESIRRLTGRVVGCMELSILAFRGLRESGVAESVTAAHGLPLALNSSDALYSLAHLALLETIASVPDLGHQIAGRVDSLSLKVWQAALGEGQAQGFFDDWNDVMARTGKLAGALAALAGGRHGEAVDALSRFCSQTVLILAGLGAAGGKQEALASLRAGRFSQHELDRLTSLLE